MPKDKKNDKENKPRKKSKHPAFFSGTGRRKTSVARVWFYPEGYKDFKGLIVNDKPIAEYFPGEAARLAYMEPIFACALPGLKVAASIKIHGGGKNSQLGAVRHGLARAILSIDEKHREPLKKRGLLTRDPRMKERKKYGRKGARRKEQWSKR